MCRVFLSAATIFDNVFNYSFDRNRDKFGMFRPCTEDHWCTVVGLIIVLLTAQYLFWRHLENTKILSYFDF